MTTLATNPTLPSGPPPAVPDDFIFRLSVDQYHEMIKAGILTSDDPVELLEGWLVQKMSKNPAHRLAKRLLRDALTAILPPSWHVEEQEPVTTSDSEPEPDIAVIRGSPRDYADHHPGPADLALVIEVADSTLRRDRGRKKRLYARAAVPVYWIVNLVDKRIEIYTDPTGPAEKPDYRSHTDVTATDTIPVIIDGTEVGRLTVADLLP